MRRTYKLTLTEIRCVEKRMQGDYHDTIAITFGAALTNPGDDPPAVPDADAGHLLPGVPLGTRNQPRLTVSFGRGTVVPLQDGPDWSNRDWSIRLDVDDAVQRPWIIGLQLVNDRDVSDPYALARFTLAVAAAVGAGAVVKELGGKREFWKQLFDYGSRIGTGFVSEAVDWLFGDWPACAGPVLDGTKTWMPSDFAEHAGQEITWETGDIRVGEGCRSPRYIVKCRVEDLTTPSLGEPSTVVSRSYAPVPSGGEHWLGRWWEQTGNLARVVIEPSALDAAGYRVSVSESLPGGDSSDVFSDVFDPVIPRSRRRLPYDGEVVRARRGRYAGIGDDDPKAAMHVIGGASADDKTMALATAFRKMRKSGDVALTVQHPLSEVLHAVAFPSVDLSSVMHHRPGGGPVTTGTKTLGDLVASLEQNTDFEAEAQRVTTALEAGDTLLAGDDLMLRLYDLTDVDQHGTERTGQILLYERDETWRATRATYVLTRARPPA